MKLKQLHEAGALSRIKGSVPDDTHEVWKLHYIAARNSYIQLLEKIIQDAGFTDVEADVRDEAPNGFTHAESFRAFYKHYPVSFWPNTQGSEFSKVQLEFEDHVFDQHNIRHLKSAYNEIEAYVYANKDDEDD